jgi:transcriptional repressor OPI1
VLEATIDSAMEVDVEKGFESPSVREFHSRRQSQASSMYQESLPAYDENRSPQYEERSGELLLITSPQSDQQQRGVNHNWSTQLMISTSGLGVALSESSLRSLKACLGMLRGATTHISNVMQALALVLADYEAATRPQRRDAEHGSEKQLFAGREEALTPEQQEASRQIAERIKALSDDIWKTLQNVVNSVSRYTGGALPDNARTLVRRQLMSVPLRWRVANQTANGSTEEGANGDQSQASEPARSAHRMLAFAKEGLDMIAQVSAVVDGTVGSAEKWLDSLGRRRPDEPSEKNGLAMEPPATNGSTEKR